MATTRQSTSAQGRARHLRFLRLASLLAAIAVFVQLAALPYHHLQTTRDLSAVAAELKATFGETAVLCAQAGESSSSTPQRHHGGCDVGCPLCQFASQLALLEPPPAALPERLAIVDRAAPARIDFERPTARPMRLAQPRAPPSIA